MKMSVVVNTCCLGPRAATTKGSSGFAHARRVDFLRELILPGLRAAFDQVVVAGEFEEGYGYEYAPSASRHFDCRDLLAQRQAGLEAARHDVIVFQMDDHLLSDDFAARLRSREPDWEILSPARFSQKSGTALNSGWNEERPEYRDNPYLHTHAIVMRRSAVEACPWNQLPLILHFDVLHSQQFREARLRVVIDRTLKVFDLEE